MVLEPLVIVEIFLEGPSGLDMVRLGRHRGVLLVPAALVILAAVVLPVAETHPTEVVLALGALHVVTAAVLLDTSMAAGAVLRVSTEGDLLVWEERGALT